MELDFLPNLSKNNWKGWVCLTVLLLLFRMDALANMSLKNNSTPWSLVQLRIIQVSKRVIEFLSILYPLKLGAFPAGFKYLTLISNDFIIKLKSSRYSLVLHTSGSPKLNIHLQVESSISSSSVEFPSNSQNPYLSTLVGN